MPPVENNTSFFRPFFAVLLPGFPPDAVKSDSVQKAWWHIIQYTSPHNTYSPDWAANTETEAEKSASLKAFWKDGTTWLSPPSSSSSTVCLLLRPISMAPLGDSEVKSSYTNKTLQKLVQKNWIPPIYCWFHNSYFPIWNMAFGCNIPTSVQTYGEP